MTTPDEARALLACAHTVMSPDDIAEHALGLAALVAQFDIGTAAVFQMLGQPYTPVEDLFPDCFGFVTLSEDGADG